MGRREEGRGSEPPQGDDKQARGAHGAMQRQHPMRASVTLRCPRK